MSRQPNKPLSKEEQTLAQTEAEALKVLGGLPSLHSFVQGTRALAGAFQSGRDEFTRELKRMSPPQIENDQLGSYIMQQYTKVLGTVSKDFFVLVLDITRAYEHCEKAIVDIMDDLTQYRSQMQAEKSDVEASDTTYTRLLAQAQKSWDNLKRAQRAYNKAYQENIQYFNRRRSMVRRSRAAKKKDSKSARFVVIKYQKAEQALKQTYKTTVEKISELAHFCKSTDKYVVHREQVRIPRILQQVQELEESRLQCLAGAVVSISDLLCKYHRRQASLASQLRDIINSVDIAQFLRHQQPSSTSRGHLPQSSLSRQSSQEDLDTHTHQAMTVRMLKDLPCSLAQLRESPVGSRGLYSLLFPSGSASTDTSFSGVTSSTSSTIMSTDRETELESYTTPPRMHSTTRPRTASCTAMHAPSRVVTQRRRSVCATVRRERADSEPESPVQAKPPHNGTSHLTEDTSPELTEDTSSEGDTSSSSGSSSSSSDTSPEQDHPQSKFDDRLTSDRESGETRSEPSTALLAALQPIHTPEHPHTTRRTNPREALLKGVRVPRPKPPPRRRGPPPRKPLPSPATPPHRSPPPVPNSVPGQRRAPRQSTSQTMSGESRRQLQHMLIDKLKRRQNAEKRDKNSP